MTTVEQLRAQVERETTLAQAKMQEQLEVARLTAKLTVLQNDSLLQQRVRHAITTDTSARLKELDLVCAEIVSSMPILDTRTRENRKWKPSKTYSYGNQVGMLTGLLSGIQYSSQIHKDQMLALTGLDEDLIEQALEALGAPAYYSRNYMEIVPETPANLEKLHSILALIEDRLSIAIDKSKLTSNVVERTFATARLRAERSYEEDQTARKLASMALDLE